MKKGILSLTAVGLTLILSSCNRPSTPIDSQVSSSGESSNDQTSEAIKVIYKDQDGNVLQEAPLNADGSVPEYTGESILVPEPEADGYYVFEGWNSSSEGGSLVYTPKIEKKTYTGFTFTLNADNTGLVLTSFQDQFYVADEQGNPSAPAPLEDFYIPEQAVFEGNTYYVTEVGDVSIKGYSIRRVHIGPYVQSFSSKAVITYDSPMVSEFIVDPANESLSVEDKVLYNKDKTELIKVPFTYSAYQFAIPDSVVKIQDQAFQLVANITYVGTSTNSKLTEIGEQAFSGSGIKSIGLPDSLTTIRIRAFWLCPNLLTIRLPKNLTVIEPLAFASCPELNTVELDEGLTFIGDSMFQGSPKIQQVVYNPADPNNANPVFTLKRVERYAFQNVTSLRSFPFNEGLEVIGESAFMDSGLSQDLVLPDSVTSLEPYAFSGTKISKLTLGKGVTTFVSSVVNAVDSLNEIEVSSNNPNYSTYEGSIYNKDQTELVFVPKGKGGHLAVKPGTKRIGDQAIFGNLNLTSIDIPASVTELGNSAINSNALLSSITFHDGLTTIGDSGLAYNKVLREIDLPATVTSVGSGAFQWNLSLSRLDLGGVSKLAKDDATFTSTLNSLPNLDFANITTEAKEGLQFNGGYLTMNGMTQETLTIPSQTTTIATNAFSGFTNLKKVDFSKATKLTVLNSNTFNLYSTTLTNVVLSSSLTRLEKDVFGTAPNLTQVEFDGTQEQWTALIKNSDPNWYGQNFQTLKSVKFKDGSTGPLNLPDPNPPSTGSQG